LISGSETSGECSRKADLPRSFSDKGFVEPVTAGLVSPPQVGGAPLAAALFASGNTIPQRPGIEQGRQQIEKNGIEAAPEQWRGAVFDSA